MMKELMLGNKAIARGLFEAGVCFVSSYPGTPSTEITEEAVKYDEIYCEWAPNEKVAMESAFGASLAGRRSFCAQAGQYFAALDAEKIGVLQSRHRFPGVTCITSAYSDGSAGRTARRRYLQIRDCDMSWGQMQASPSSRSRQFP